MSGHGQDQPEATSVVEGRDKTGREAEKEASRRRYKEGDEIVRVENKRCVCVCL